MIGNEMLGVLRAIYINKQMRRYYGKKYDRQTSANKGRRTQAGHITCKGRCDQSRTGKIKARIESC
jgi:hypothetical protein